MMDEKELGPEICAMPWKKCDICGGLTKGKRSAIMVKPFYAMWNDPFYRAKWCGRCSPKVWGYHVEIKSGNQPDGCRTMGYFEKLSEAEVFHRLKMAREVV